MKQTYAGKEVDVNEEGYFTDMTQWTKEMAPEIASSVGINQLGEKHMAVINWLRDQVAGGEELTIRKVGSSGVVDIKEFYALFPNGPLKNACKIAGLKKPATCL